MLKLYWLGFFILQAKIYTLRCLYGAPAVTIEIGQITTLNPDLRHKAVRSSIPILASARIPLGTLGAPPIPVTKKD